MPSLPEDDKLREMPADGIFSVAFSFAGPQRELVQEIVQHCEKLLGRGKVFYDKWFPHGIAGEGVTNLQDIFSKAQLIVACVSADYESRQWPASEWRFIQDRIHRAGGSGATSQRMPFLPIRVGEGDFKGVMSTNITLDARDPERPPAKMAEIIAYYLKLATTPAVEGPLPVANALVLPSASHLSRVRDDLVMWLELQRIAVMNLDVRLSESLLDQQADEMLASADVVVRWLQSSSAEADQVAIACHDRIFSQKIEGKKAEQKTRRWIPDDVSGPDGANADSGSRKMRWEEFKGEVFKMATEPPSHGIVIGAAAVDRPHASLLLTALDQQRRPDQQRPPREAHYDKLHLPLSFQTDPDFDERIFKAIRKRPRGLVLIHGESLPDWLVERLQAYDLFRDGKSDFPRLVVWRLPAPTPRPPLDFWPEDIEEVNSSDPADVLAIL